MTIIILLILAGITINLVLADGGIFEKAQHAKNEWEDAITEEEKILGDIDNAIDEYVTGERETGTITITKEEYETLKNTVEELKPKSITDETLLLKSTHSGGTVSGGLASMDNDFSDGFETSFSYDPSTGELTCLNSGWCLITFESMSKAGSSGVFQYGYGQCWVTVNGVEINIYNSTNSTSWHGDDIMLYFNSGDKISFRIYGSVANGTLSLSLNLYKL